MISNPLQHNTAGLGRRTSKAPDRVDFSKIYTTARIPNLIEVQRESYNRFLQMDLIPEERDTIGLQSVFGSIFPLFSPIVMPSRIVFNVPYWQIGLSMALLLATTVFMVWLAGRIYRVGILMYGKKASFKELRKWMFYKD